MAEPMVYMPIRTRILKAVRSLDNPTTLDVAEAAMVTTAEAREHLRALADEGAVLPVGRRWEVPCEQPVTEMVEPATVPVSDEDGIVEERPASTVGCIFAGVAFAFILAAWMHSCSVMP